jgi:hypothetical protein
MRNTPKGLNEELTKMRKLMNFDISENSHDVLSENFIKKSVITEQSNYEKLEQQKDLRANNERVNKILDCAGRSGYPIIEIRKEAVSQDFSMDPLPNLFYNNFVTLEDGLRPGALADIDTEIKKVQDQLTNYKVKPEDVTITINSSADAKEAKNDPYDKKGATKIDHDYDGQSANNEYLAKMRGVNLGKYLSTKIPGIKITYKPEVSKNKGDEYIFAKFIGKFNIPVMEEKISHELKIGWNLNGYYQSTDEWNKKMASPDCTDNPNCGCQLNNENEFFSVGPGRILSIPNFSAGYSFVGDTDLIPEKTVNTGAAEVETTCTRITGINGKIGNLGGTAQTKGLTHTEKIVAYLVSSGYFTKEEATKIVGKGGLLSYAAPKDGSDDGNTISKLGTSFGTTMKVSTEGWDNFLDAFGKSGQFNVESAKANGAIVIKYDEKGNGVVESAGKCR